MRRRGDLNDGYGGMPLEGDQGARFHLGRRRAGRGTHPGRSRRRSDQARTQVPGRSVAAAPDCRAISSATSARSRSTWATARGVELARALAAKSDIVIDNFSARVMRSWGMDYASLRRVKPEIICISMSGLGHTGPRCELRQLRARRCRRSAASPLMMARRRRRARRIRLLLRRHVRRLYRRARGVDRAMESAAHRQGPVRGPLAVRGA